MTSPGELNSLSTDAPTIIRVPLEAHSHYRVPPCAFAVPSLPDPKLCPRPGFIAELSLATAQVALGPSTRIQAIPASGIRFSSHSRKSDNRSVLDLVASGEADMTPPNLILSSSRIGRLPFSGPVFGDKPVLFYRSRWARADLNWHRLLWHPAEIWFLLASLTLLLHCLYRFERASRANAGLRLFLWLLYTATLSLLGNCLNVVFVSPRSLRHFRHLGEIKDGLATGELRLSVQNDLIINRLEEVYPNIFASTSVSIDHILRPEAFFSDGEQFLVHLTYRTALAVGPLRKLALDPTIPTTVDDVEVATPLLTSIYYHPKGPAAPGFPLSEIKIGVIRAVFRDLQRKYFGAAAIASSEELSSSGCGLSEGGETPSPIKFTSLGGLLSALLAGSGLGSLALGLELAQARPTRLRVLPSLARWTQFIAWTVW